MALGTLANLVRLPLWLLLGPGSEESGWSFLLGLAIQLLVIGLIFRAWIGPLLLQKVSKRVQVRRVSLRSVRGVYIRLASMTIRIDRVGLSYHPSAEAARRFSFKVEGLSVEIHELKARAPPPSAQKKRFSMMPTMADFAPSTTAGHVWSACSVVYTFLEPYARPAIRSFFVISTRVIIRCLPVLTQVVDFELDRALITLTALPEAHLAVRSITLSTTVAFSNLESVVGSAGDPSQARQRQSLLSMSHMQTRFAGSAKRVWGRAWGRTRGTASFSLKVHKVSGYASLDRWLLLDADTAVSPQSFVASRFALVTDTSHFSDKFFDLPGTAEVASSFEFGPTKRIIQDHSIMTSIRIPSIHISMESLRTFFIAFNNLRATKDFETDLDVRSRRRRNTSSRYYNTGALARKPQTSSVLSMFRSVDFLIKDSSILHLIKSRDSAKQRSFTGHVRSLSIGLVIGEHERGSIHKDFLGDCPERDPEIDSDIISFSFIAKDMTVHRRSIIENSPPSRVISISSVSLQGFATQWSLIGMPTAPIFPGDPNAALAVIKLNVLAPQLSERMDVVSDVLEYMQQSRAMPSSPREPLRILHSVPRLSLDVAVDDVAACLTPVGVDGTPLSSLILSSTQCVITVSSYFKYFPLAKSSLPEIESQSHIPLEMEFTAQSLLGPAFVAVLPKPFALDSARRTSGISGSSQIGGDPLLSLGAIEVALSGQCLGGSIDSTDEVVLDLGTTMMDVSCITEAISLELWQPSAISSLKSLFETTRKLSKTQPKEESLLKRLPSNITAHMTVGQIRIILTGRDINPDEDLDISRGIAAKSGFSMQYCSLHDRQNYARIPKRFTHSHDRQRLSLSEDLLLDVISISGPLKSTDKKFALARCSFWDITVRTSIATEFDADQAYEAEEEAEELKSSEFLWIRRVEVNALASYLDSDAVQKDVSERLQLSARIPYIQSRIELSHAYCTLLALGTLQSLISSRPKSQHQTPNQISFTFKANVTTIQLQVKFPLQQQICFRVNSLILRGSERYDMGIELGAFFAWVPSLREQGKWEELGRLRTWKLACSRKETREMVFAIEGEGARLRIPYGYIMADLILDVNLFVKCLKHLSETVFWGAWRGMPLPATEAANMVPIINVKIGCISVEAADDPLESKLGLIWRAGFDAARSRLERQEAFEEKVVAIKAAEVEQNSEGRFTPQHSISIEEARDRLLLVHSISWISLHREHRDEQRKKETNIKKELRGDHSHISGVDVEPLVPLAASSKAPPLIRFIIAQLTLNISRPQLPANDLPEFLHDLGNGLPRETQYTLLVPLHLHMTLGSSCVMLRDYPLPLVNIVQESTAKPVAWVINMDLVIAEEMGLPTSVVWKECPIVLAGLGSAGTKPLNLSVPKTTMPVKTYANPIVNVLTNQLTEFCWGISYAAALQDVMRILDTLSTPPPDPSPAIGFWDKLRLILHWRAELNFVSDVHLNLKGSRDPYATDGAGAGFAFCWSGNTKMSIGQENADNEILQVYSDTMLIVIPRFSKRVSEETTGEGISSRIARGPLSLNQGLEGRQKSFKKICAKFSSGIKWGIGIVLERACGTSCPNCSGKDECRLFNFRPHHEIMLEPKPIIPIENTPEDSFNGFRSDFIHLSTSLSSSVRRRASTLKLESNSFHLSPKTFAHFWSWWETFDRLLSIPIRQGNLFPNARPPSKKFGKHLATIKYRLAIQQLFISHIYLDESRETWSNGTTNCVGVKALVHLFEADMHQREQEAIVPGVVPNTVKKIRHKPFYAAEVKLVDLQLRAILATFSDPSKHLIDPQESSGEDRYKNVKPDLADEAPNGFWFDFDDFVETDWKPTEDDPLCYMLPVASCPRFTYFKRTNGHPHHGPKGEAHNRSVESSRFGVEDTHVCLMGTESSVHRVQSEIVEKRVIELKRQLYNLQHTDQFQQNGNPDHDSHAHTIEKKLRQLERHLVQLRETDDLASPLPEEPGDYAYLMPSDISFPGDWTEFNNVYQAHCPKFTLSNSIRDILTQYYYCSRSRRGFEYHMATRAVKYIRDQVDAYSRVSSDTDDSKRFRRPTEIAAQVAAHALRKILIGNESDNAHTRASGTDDIEAHEQFDPMSGWSDEAVSLHKSHFCLLLKPQVVLRSEASKDSVLVLAALQATLQSHTILDTANIDDPISGRVMTRTHAVLSGLQTFSPSASCPSRHEGIPLEVLIDLRAESDDFNRLVPQTDATFRYDKFNRLRLRNNVTSAVPNSADQSNSHLQHQTDLIDVQMPRFTVSANSKNFEAIANIITNLLLFSDSAHKMHLNKVETLLFSYDFTDLLAAAHVVEDLQSRLRRTAEYERSLEDTTMDNDEAGRTELMKIKAHFFILAEELNLIFDAIKLAQEKADDKHEDTKMALKVHASARDISWGMVDDLGEMIAKLAVRGIDFTWLSRQDGSTVNNLLMMDLQAFDGSPDAEWPEILAKHREPSNHPLVKRGVFVQADWIVLAPVGGITIYEQFILDLHPMRLQLEARVGKNIMEYVWPARRDRRRLSLSPQSSTDDASGSDYFLRQASVQIPDPIVVTRASLDSPSTLHQKNRYSTEERRPTLGLPSRRITGSRSFTDLRSASRQNSTNSVATVSSDLLVINKPAFERSYSFADSKTDSTPIDLPAQKKAKDDAAEMKTRSAQKTFVLVRISSMNILLSFHKDGSFFCRDARIHTRELQYRNQTWSFEELADQFIPTDTSWRGWMRMALHQPLVPVLPVARELFSKTKWIAAKGKVARKAIKPGQTRLTTESLRNSEQSASGTHGHVLEPLKRPKSKRSTETADDS